MYVIRHTHCLIDTISKESIYHILIADLFHDFNHSGGEFEDSVNIGRAISELRSKEFKKVLDEHEDDFSFPINLNYIEKLISCTKFPYTSHDVDIHEGIMRDSDMWPLLSEDMIQICIFNLSRENKSELSLKKLIENQIKFIESFMHKGFYTPQANFIYDDKLQQNLNQLIQFSNIF